MMNAKPFDCVRFADDAQGRCEMRNDGTERGIPVLFPLTYFALRISHFALTGGK
jgi:hypothetical protein